IMPVRWLTRRARTRCKACRSSCSAVFVATNFIVGRCTASAIASASRKSFFYLATRPFLMQHNRAAFILPYDMERVLADIDANHGDCGIEILRHGVLLVFSAPGQHEMLVGQEHG